MAVPVSMSTADMIESFNIEYDRIIAQVAQAYTDEEILIFLNRAQEQLVTELYTSKRLDLLGSLYVNGDYITTGIGNPVGISNGCYFLTSNIGFTYTPMFVTDVYPSIVRSALPIISVGTYARAEWIPADQAGRFVADGSMGTLLFRTPKVYQEGTEIIILFDSFTTVPPAEIAVKYMRYPLILVISGDEVAGESVSTCELDAKLHKSLVTKAVYLAKEATDRLQQQQTQQQ